MSTTGVLAATTAFGKTVIGAWLNPMVKWHAAPVAPGGPLWISCEEQRITLEPDGKRMGVTHDFLWQVAALVLGTRVLSQAEYEAIVGRLERSVRHWALRPVSRNYVGFLRQHLIGADDGPAEKPFPPSASTD